MTYHDSYINSAKKILQQYEGTEPFASFLKKYFSLNKKFGSRDRKQVTHLAYCYFRMGRMRMDLAHEERMLMGLFLCSNKSHELLDQLKPGWNEKVALTAAEKLSFLGIRESIYDIFPFATELSGDIDQEAFILSHFQQPDLFLRLRPGRETTVKQQLEEAGIDFQSVGDRCLALPNTSKIDSIIALNRDAVVQDLSSQRTGDAFEFSAFNRQSAITAWDCCAGSGGKSIMLCDLFPTIRLTVSDIRDSILINLRKRLGQAGIKNYQSFTLDLTRSPLAIRHSPFDLVLADIPCSGSGTWGRAPEQLHYFEKEKIDRYASLQRQIAGNLVPHLRKQGYMLYITCSVYKKENEETAGFLEKEHGLRIISQSIIKGYDKKADTLFAALLQKQE